jgi:hypothetical protein
MRAAITELPKLHPSTNTLKADLDKPRPTNTPVIDPERIGNHLAFAFFDHLT